MRLLLVDDSDTIETYVRAAVETEGWQVIRARDGAEALRRAKEVPPDAIVLDFVLPDMDGLEVLEELFAARVRAPTIVVSGAQSSDIMGRFADAGAVDYLSKEDLTPARLRAALRMALDVVYAEEPSIAPRRTLRGSPEEDETAPERPTRGSVLVIDDTASMRQLIEVGLRARDWRVLLAEDARRGIELAKSEAPDVILLDHVLPDATGLEVLRSLREMDIDAPVVALTGHGDEGLAEEFLRDGASDYLTKDALTLPRLAFALERALWIGGAVVDVQPAMR